MANISSKAPPRFFGLDHLRALAILLVLGFHYQLAFGHPNWSKWFMNFGWTGVDLFFVLSGFLISSQLFSCVKKGKPISLRQFFIKRGLRILPLYFFIVGIYFLFPFFREKEALPPLWKFLTFTQNFGLDLKESGTFSHAWSLCVEEHFYLLLPLILISLQNRKLFAKSYWILIGLFVFGIALRTYLWNTYYPSDSISNPSLSYWTEHIYYPTYNRLDGLLAGISIAAFCQFSPKSWDKISKFGNHLIFIGIVLLTVAYFYYAELGAYSTSIWGFPLISIGYGFLVLGAISPSSFLYKWDSRSATLIATLSYAIYLSHKGIIHISQELFSKLGLDKAGNLMFLICVVFCILFAWLLNLGIERPFMKLRARVIRSKIKP